MSNLRALYADILKTAFVSVDDLGILYNALSKEDDRTDLTLQGKKLRLSGPNVNYGAEYFTVHPLVELISSSTSTVIERLMLTHAQALHLKVQTLFADILVFGTSPAEQSKAKHELGDMLKACADAGKSEITQFTQLMQLANSPTTQDYRFIKLKIKPQIRRGGVTYPFGTVVTFPLYEKLLAHSGRKIGTVPVSQKAVKVFKNILEFIFPDITDGEAYLFEGKLSTGPRYSSILEAVNDICGRLNEVLDTMEGVETNEDLIYTDLSWYSNYQKFDKEYISEARIWTKETVQAAQSVNSIQNQTPAMSPAAAQEEINALRRDSRLVAQNMQAGLNTQMPPNSHYMPPRLPEVPMQGGQAVQQKSGDGRRSFAEFMQGANPAMAQAGTTSGASMVQDAQGRTWIIQNGVPVQCAPVGQMTPQMQAPPPQMVRQVAPQMPPQQFQVPMGAVGVWTDPSTGQAWYVDQNNQILGQAPQRSPGLVSMQTQMQHNRGVGFPMAAQSPGFYPASPQQMSHNQGFIQPVGMGAQQGMQQPMGMGPQMAPTTIHRGF